MRSSCRWQCPIRAAICSAAARLRIADALGDEVRSVAHLAETCQADVDALYRLLRALASIGITEETTPKHFRLTPFGRPRPSPLWILVNRKFSSTAIGFGM